MRYILIIVVLMLSFNLFSEEKGAVSDIRANEILEYGIDSEVSSLLKELPASPSGDIYIKLEERYKKLKSPSSKIEFINYIAKTKNCPESMIDLIYEDASKENADRSLITASLMTFSKVGSKRESDFILKKLEDNDIIIKSAATDAISVMKRAEFSEPLLERLNDTSSDREPLSDDIKGKLIIFFGENKTKEAVPYLQTIISNKNNNKFMIINGMVALLKIGDISSLPQIEENLNDGDSRVQEYAAYSISSFENSAVIPILNKMLMNNNEAIRINALKGIVLNKDTSSIPIVLYKMKNDPSPKVKEEAFATLLCLGNSGIEEIKKLYSDKRFSASNINVISRSVAAKPDSDNVPFLLDIYMRGDKKEREQIAKNIVGSRSNLVDPIISELLKSEDYLIRLGGLKAVANIENSSLWGEVEDIASNDKVQVVKTNAQKYLETNLR